MSITAKEFEVTMNLMEAERQFSPILSVYRFKIGTTVLTHSGGNYATYQDDMLPTEVVANAIQILGEKQKDIIWNEIHSTRGLVVLVLLLKGTYNKKTFNFFIDKIYKELFNSSLLQKTYSTSCRKVNLSTAEKLSILLMQYDKMINPFSCSHKKPASKYLDDLKLELYFDSSSLERPNIKLSAAARNATTTEFISSPFQIIYYAEYLNDNENYTGYKSFKHSYSFDYDCSLSDEILMINLQSNTAECNSIRVNLSKGTIWSMSMDGRSEALTDTHLNIINTYLEECISRVQKSITSQILD